MKSPVYTEVHSLIQLQHKNNFRKIAKTIAEVKKKYDLCDVLEINEVKMGT